MKSPSHVDFKPLLDLLPAHWALAHAHGQVAVLDGNDDVGAPLTHDHVSARQDCDVGQLLIAHPARQTPRHFLVCQRLRAVWLAVERLDRLFRLHEARMHRVPCRSHGFGNNTQTLDFRSDLLDRVLHLRHAAAVRSR
jgi:hypothetical protein